MQTNYLNKSSVPVIWDFNQIKFNWKELYSYDQVTPDDPWDSPATTLKLQQEALYNSWGIEKTCTKHYQSYVTELGFDPNEIFKLIPGHNHSYNFLKLGAGRILPWHLDTYTYYINVNGIPSTDIPTVRRLIVMMNDWSNGQVLQYGDQTISHWQAGDTLTWSPHMWHGAANFGHDDLVVMIINYQTV
jgi:hypothetical protein